MKIKQIDLTRVHNDEHFQFCTDFINLVNAVGVSRLKVQKLFDAFLPLYRQEDEALKKITKSALTSKIEKADRARDTVFRGMVDANRAALNHFTAGVAEAAERLQIVFDTYGNLAKKSHMEETSAVTNLLAELMQNHQANMSLVGLNVWAEELDKRNAVVQTLMNTRADENAGRTSLVLKEVRARVDDAYQALVTRIDALALLDGDSELEDDDDGVLGELSQPVGALGVGAQAAGETGDSVYTDFIRRLNERIDQVNHAVAVRRGVSKKHRQNQDS
jgi:hypothetical protein